MIKQIQLPDAQLAYLKTLYQAAEEAKRMTQVVLGAILAGHDITSVKSARVENNLLIYDDGIENVQSQD